MNNGVSVRKYGWENAGIKPESLLHIGKELRVHILGTLPQKNIKQVNDTVRLCIPLTALRIVIWKVMKSTKCFASWWWYKVSGPALQLIV